MPLFNEIKEYSDIVCKQIRWKKARRVVSVEIENHIHDQRDAYIAAGDNEKTATDKAILQMGDAISVGMELDKTHRPKAQWSLIGLTGILMLIGVLTHYIIDTSGASFVHFSIVPYLIAACIFLICYHADFTILGRHPIKLYFAVLGLSLLAVLFGTKINGRLIWSLGRLSTPLAYLSLIFPLVFSLIVYSTRNKRYRGILLDSLGFLPLAIVLFIIPTKTGLILYAISSLAILCFSIAKGWFGVNKKQGLSIVLLCALILSIATMIFLLRRSPYMINRFVAFLNPYADRLGTGYIYILIRDFLSESILFGKGSIPQTVTSIAQLPEIGTDYSLVYLIHQYGFVVLLAIVACITLFSVLGIYKTLKQTSVLGTLVALSVLLSFTLQSVFYIIDNLGYGLVSSLSLPFISYGRSALFINAALTGFMLSVFRTGDIHKDSSISYLEPHSLFFYRDGRLIIDFKGMYKKVN